MPPLERLCSRLAFQPRILEIVEPAVKLIEGVVLVGFEFMSCEWSRFGDVGLRVAPPQQLGQHLALPLKRLALLRKRLGHGLALPLKRLALLFEGLDALPHILRHHVNFSISSRAGFPHPLQSYEDRKQPFATDGKLGNLHPARAIRGLQGGYCPLRQL